MTNGGGEGWHSSSLSHNHSMDNSQFCPPIKPESFGPAVTISGGISQGSRRQDKEEEVENPGEHHIPQKKA